MKKDEPMNRIVPAILSITIIGFYYAIKFKKLQKYSIVISLTYIVLVIGVGTFEIAELTGGSISERDYRLLESIINIAKLVSVLSIIWLMYDWAGQYNLEKFGYEDKKEWKKKK